jgi:hypothetical protein
MKMEHSVFRNVGIQNSDAGELPRRKHTTQFIRVNHLPSYHSIQYALTYNTVHNTVRTALQDGRSRVDSRRFHLDFSLTYSFWKNSVSNMLESQQYLPIPVDARSKARVCGRWLAGSGVRILFGAWMFFCCERCVVR